MSRGLDRDVATAAAMREEFDRSFAVAPEVAPVVFESFLAVRAGGDPYVIRLSDITSLHRDRKVVPFVNSGSQLLGIMAFRGAMAPVYDLRALLGYPGGPTPRWLVLAGMPSPVGLAFDLCEGHLRVAQDSVSRPDVKESARRQHVEGVVHGADAARPIIRIASMLEAIARRAPQDSPRKER